MMWTVWLEGPVAGSCRNSRLAKNDGTKSDVSFLFCFIWRLWIAAGWSRFFLQPEKSLYVVGDILKCKFPVCSLLEGGETAVFCRLIVFSCCKSILVPWNVCWGRYIYYINIFFDLFFSHFYHKWAISDFLFLLLCCITQFCSSNGKD